MGVAYRMLGRVADAEDVVQEAWLRWSSADREQVREPRAYLVRVTTRLAIDRLRQVQARREDAFPLAARATGHRLRDGRPRLRRPRGPRRVRHPRRPGGPGIALALASARSSSCARRSATRTAEIATVLEPRGRAPTRGRARRHVKERRPRFEVDPHRQRDLTERFLAAAAGDDLDGLLHLLAEDVRLVGDSGGKAKAPLRVIETADKVGRFLLGVARGGIPAAEFVFTELNGGIALLVLSEGKPDSVFQVDVVDGRIQTVYIIRNPDKLGALDAAG
ncbi:RNA polymerase sigma-70 factor OS=Streptomyces rimosus subsp. rimosus (strain ATCC / DSM 40260/ JCM 4667 / NRRL 2234) OX=1265868 GN=SRIM_003870 PE=3 SV=1 [Streptomyces rimosus subsp. rimosus]